MLDRRLHVARRSACPHPRNVKAQRPHLGGGLLIKGLYAAAAGVQGYQERVTTTVSRAFSIARAPGRGGSSRLRAPGR